ncbi:unnamed protein product [Cladocopium goreaui]|uniref:Uncharacterized protein n=1 Tax=Cladocopium goreaui TaxID=2562237 RepID=A0A9P1BPA1_9DINO|nr:unnamed protein product [Cladocopium goreaui]
MRSDGRPAVVSSRYAEGPVVLRAASSTPVVSSGPSRRTEDEVGAERLWWSDYCEQKLQELQLSFTKAIDQVTERMQADLRLTEDRLVELVDLEKNARSAQLLDLGRQVDHQHAEISEMVRSQVELRDQLATRQDLRSVVGSPAGALSATSDTTCKEHSFNQSSEVEQMVIKALSNEVNKRCHDLETQMRKIDFDAASIFARLDSVEADTIKLSRESHDVQTLRSDVEAVKRRLLVQTDRPSIAATGLPGLESARRRALFPPELRENISSCVQKVGETVDQALPGDEVTSDTASFHSGAKSGSDLPEQLQQQLKDGTVSQEGYLQALAVMQQLKERNDSLREKNAELAEEMFVPGARASMPLPSWSADQMIPADIRGGSGMAPAAPYQHQTGAMRSSSPGFRTVRAKMAAVPTAVPTTAVPGVIGTPVLVAQVPAVPAVSGTVPRTASPDRRQYF